MEYKEFSVIKCKVCGETKKRFLAGKWGTCKKWVDEEGNLFNGKRCPTCELSRVKDSMKKIREKKRDKNDIV